SLCLRATVPSSAYISTLSLHDALPILARVDQARPCARPRGACGLARNRRTDSDRKRILPWITELDRIDRDAWDRGDDDKWTAFRSEEHTSELQSRVDLVCRLLLEKKNK